MKIIVDTCVWSFALRRGTPKESEIVRELTELIKEVRIQLIGPIRQELLSGIKSEKHFNDLKHYLSAYPDLTLHREDFEKAAEYYNVCRAKGIQGSNTDFLICSLSHIYDYEIFTTDKDLLEYQKLLPIKLYHIRKHK